MRTDVTVFAYDPQTGETLWRLQMDGDQTHDWHLRVTAFDHIGENPVITTYDSAADLPELYIGYIDLPALDA